MNARRRIPRRISRGIALVESLVAVLLLGIGLLGAIGLQARAGSALADTGMRAEATMAADRLFGIMAVDLPNLGAYALAPGGTAGARLLPWYNETTGPKGHIPNATIGVTVTAQSGRTRVDVSISWTRKAGAPANTQHVVAYLGPAT